MESKEPITAEAFFLSKEDPRTDDDVINLMHEYAVLFAKHHREKAIEMIKARVHLKIEHRQEIMDNIWIDSPSGVEIKRDDLSNPYWCRIFPCKDSIENAYLESEIK